jgi:hypothetical protein
LNGTYQLLAYAGVNIMEGNTDTIKKNTEALRDASKEVGLEVNPGKKNVYVKVTYQKAGKRHSIKIDNRSFENVTALGYLEATITNQNSMNEEIKSKINSGNYRYNSVQSLVSKKVKVKM